MQHRNKLFAVFMSFAMMISLAGMPAFADEPVSSIPNETGTMPDRVSDSIPKLSSDENSFELDAGSDTSNIPGVDNSPKEKNSVSESPAPELNNEDRDSDARRIVSADALGFIYIDKSVVAIGDKESIALGLLDENAAVENARLDIKRLDTGEIVEVEADTIVDGAILFTRVFSNDTDTAVYQLAGVRYETGGVAFYADLIDVADNEAYVFDVVTSSVASAITESSKVSKDGEVSAYAVNGDGTLVAAGSVEEAVGLADAVSAQNTEAGDSIVDQEMLNLGITSEESDGVEGQSESFSSDALGIDSNNAIEVASDRSVAGSLAGAREEYLIVALDPGHGGWDSGAAANGLTEKVMNLSIAKYCESELKTYSGIMPIMTRTEDYYVGLQERVDIALTNGADVFISIHCNAGGGMGAEVYYPNNSSYNYGNHIDGKDLASKILGIITSLGLTDRGIKIRNSEHVGGEGPFYYPDGSIQDYYTVIEAARENNIPGLIVEHAFIDNASDASKLAQDSFRNQLGQADAMGIADKYGLVKESIAQSQSIVKTMAHVANVGWLTGVYDNKVAGTVGKNFGLQAFQVNLQNAAASSGGIQYRSYVGDSWQDWVSNGSSSGTTGRDTALQAIEIKLTGNVETKYDVYYRVHVANIGWLGWAKNGASAGSIGYSYNAEAIEVTLVAKGSAAPGDTTTPFKTKTETVEYQTHVSEVGWQSAVEAGSIAGTTGRGLAIEALRASIANKTTAGSIQYNVHCSDIGWQGWKSDGALGGTTGQARQTEAIQVKLTGDLAAKYDIYYRVHSAEFGWLDWACNGQTAGTEGYGYSMQAIETKLVKKGSAAPGPTTNHSYAAVISYQAHVSNVGWQGSVFDGETAGTTGSALAVEALLMSLKNQAYSGELQARAHVSNIGWQNYTTGIVGTTGRALAVEAIQVELTGEMAVHYDLYYRAHSSNFGWLDWTKNGESAGSQGYSYSMEAIQIVLVSKGGSAPGPTASPFKQKASTLTEIMGASSTSVDRMVARYSASRAAYPTSVYSKYGALNIAQFCTILKQEADAEGVRAEVLFSQVMVETGWLQFRGDVKAEQCNFGGLGATGNGERGNSFNDWGDNSVRKGLRAQVQHLKCYASTEGLRNERVDPRWGDWLRGKAPYVEWLSIPSNPHHTGWAADAKYASKLKEIMDTI